MVGRIAARYTLTHTHTPKPHYHMLRERVHGFARARVYLLVVIIYVITNTYMHIFPLNCSFGYLYFLFLIYFFPLLCFCSFSLFWLENFCASVSGKLWCFLVKRFTTPVLFIRVRCTVYWLFSLNAVHFLNHSISKWLMLQGNR